ncbi:Unknown protein [Striga hermonthica]|uniref:Uncharacterized protein n=1 Tax=Striga hermonthica TaxID=68872 RepID=A0A9N7MXV5_STRHE|nr:Unknown protein [Striga hermonthica]
MQITFRLASNPSFLFTPNGGSCIPSLRTVYFAPVPRRNSHRKSILCAANRRKRFGIGKSEKLVLESACVIASKLGFLPEPLGLLLRQCVGGGGNDGGGNGFWNGFGRGWSDGWRRRRKGKLGMVGILVICGLVGAWFVLGKELVLDVDAVIGGLGLILFAFSAGAWRTGGNKDWILGFCCCAFLVGLVSRKDNFRTRVVRYIGTAKKNLRRKRRVF